jgi:hypothetical protein
MTKKPKYEIPEYDPYTGELNPYYMELTKMNKEEAKDKLIEVLWSQVVDLTMMSKIELGDDVIAEVKRLKQIIDEQ